MQIIYIYIHYVIVYIYIVFFLCCKDVLLMLYCVYI